MAIPSAYAHFKECAGIKDQLSLQEIIDGTQQIRVSEGTARPQQAGLDTSESGPPRLHETTPVVDF